MPVSTVMRNFAAATTLAGGVALGKLDESAKLYCLPDSVFRNVFNLSPSKFR